VVIDFDPQKSTKNDQFTYLPTYILINVIQVSNLGDPSIALVLALALALSN